MSGIFNRLELDVMQANELKESVELAHKHNFPAIVVHPGLAGDAIGGRGRVRGRFKIITPVDWSKGDAFGLNKFRGLDTDALDADGFEIMLSGGKTEIETKHEAIQLSDFIRKHLGEQIEVRFVLGAFIRDDANLISMCKGLLGVRTPAFVRTDTQLKLQVSKANTEEHNRIRTIISDIVKVPIKLSGNITGVRCVTGCDVQRYAVNLLQAKAIIKEFQQQPGALKELLDDDGDDELDETGEKDTLNDTTVQ